MPAWPARAETGAVLPPSRPIEIGVLSHRGKAVTEQHWEPTAVYLTERIPQHCFRIRPLAFDEVEPAVASGRADFLLVNPAIYVDLEVRHRISRIATLRNGAGRQARNLFGGVIFTRANRPDIGSLAGLDGKRLMAVDPNSLGGYLMALDVLETHGLRVPGNLASLEFAGVHDDVGLVVRDDRAALAGGYSGWTVPLDYRPVHWLLRNLQRPPYDQPEPFTLLDALRRYWLGVVIGIAALLIMLALTGRLHALNARLNRAKSTPMAASSLRRDPPSVARAFRRCWTPFTVHSAWMRAAVATPCDWPRSRSGSSA